MLALTRRAGQAIVVDGDIEIHVIRIEGDRVVLGIRAPKDVPISRAELVAEVGAEVRAAAGVQDRVLGALKPRA